MRNSMIIAFIIAFIGIAATTTKAQGTIVPFSYDIVVDWDSVAPTEQKKFLDYANAAAYLSACKENGIDSIVQTAMYKNVKRSRSQNGVEDEIRITALKGQEVLTFAFATKDLPEIKKDAVTGKLSVNGLRGDTKTEEQLLISRGPYAL